MILAVVQGILAISYPLIIWFGLARFEPRVLALFVLAFAALRWVLGRGALSGGDGGDEGEAAGPRRSAEALRGLAGPALLMGAVVVGVIVWNDEIGLLMMPVAISLTFLLTFGFSLVSGPPMVERFARLQVATLSPEEIAYCRRVTLVWCVFFVLNATIAGGLAFARALDAWVLYTGLISYLLMGLLFGSEYLYRHWRFRRYTGAFSDSLLKRVFPPREENSDAPAEPFAGTSDSNRLTPDLRERSEDGDIRRVVWGVGEDLDCWPGHFPDQALVPGVLQLGWVIKELEAWQGGALRLHRIERLKFKLPVMPGDVLRGEMQRTERESGGWTFRVELFLRDESATTLQVSAEDEGAAVSAGGEPGVFEPEGESNAPLSTGGNWPRPSAILPHSGNMLWLDQIIGHEEDETVARTRTEGLGPFREADGGAGAWHMLEWMAQTVAAHDGVRRHQAGEPIRPGMLLGTKRLELFGGALPAQGAFDVRVRHVFGGESGMVSYDCEVWESGASPKLRTRARLACRVGTAGAPLV